MDLSSIGFLFVIVLVGGVAAFVGDNLGKKIGKKRLSYGGLRPRHTAAIITFLFGVGVSGLTILLVSLLSAPVRSWIVHGSQAIADAKRVTRLLDQEKVNLANVQGQESALRKQAASESQEIAAQKEEIGKQNVIISRDKALIPTLNADIANKNARLLLNQRKLEENKRALATVTASLEPLTKRLSLVSKAYNESIKHSQEVFEKNTQYSESISRQKEELASLSNQKEELETTKRRLVAEVERNTSDLESLKSDLGELKSELSDVTDKLSTARTAAAKSDELSHYLQKDFIQTRLQPMIYSRFQEVTRLALGPNLSSKEADDAVETLLNNAQGEAANRGARAQGEFRAADIIDRPDGTTAEQIKKLLHDKIVGNPEPIALIAVASFNSYEHEPIAIDVLVKPNPLVYRRGEILKQTDLNGNASDNDIIKALTAFGASLRDKAQRDQMIPRSNGDAFGSVPADEVFSLVNSVKQAGRIVRLQAIVQSDTRAADPLRLDFRIR